MAKTFIPTLFGEEEVVVRPLNSLFDELRNWASHVNSYGDMEVYEDEEAITVEAPLPGLKPDQIRVNLKEGVLYIFGERKEEKKNVRYHRKLASKYSFQLVLPQPVDETAPIEAETKDGILRIRLPKSRASKPTKIPVKAV